MDIDKIIKYYNDNCSLKVFCSRLMHDSVEFYIMYIYNYSCEFENFSETFLNYLPFYVRNFDQITTIDETKNLKEQLIERSTSIFRNSELLSHRAPEINGIYGELFLDYYLRIIKKQKTLITFANKRAYASKQESKGTDSVVYYIDNDDNLNVCFCEAKFVSGASSAKDDLIHDIEGDNKEKGHITKEYLNSYIHFIVEKGIVIQENDKYILQPFINELNSKLDNGNDFISVIVEKNICVNFVFFAIFDSKKRTPQNLFDYYNEIYDKCETKINEIGFDNYKIEIVFIPTENKPIDIKREINKAYE